MRSIPAHLIFAFGLLATFDRCYADMTEPLENRLTPALVEQLFPESSGRDQAIGDPPIATVLSDDMVIGYLFSTHETIRPAGYSGNSFDIVIGLRKDGTIVGHKLLEEHEPLISDGMIGPKKFELFLSGLNGFKVGASRPLKQRTTKKGPQYLNEYKNIDAISGATISALAMHRAIINSALRVGHLNGIIDGEHKDLTLDLFSYEQKSWSDLINEKSIVSRSISYAEVLSELTSQTLPRPQFDGENQKDDDTFITLFVGLATLPSVGRNLFGVRAHRRFTENSELGEQHLFIGSKGPYAWIPKNSALVPIFERIQIRQGERIFPLLPENFYRAQRLAIDDHPSFKNAGRLRIPSHMKLKPLEPWTLELRVFETLNEGGERKAINFSLPYRVPSQYVIGSDLALEKAGLKDPRYVALGLWRESTLSDWQALWLEKRWSIAILLTLLGTVTAIIFSHHFLCRFKQTYGIIRFCVLVITLVWLGWIAGTQMTILNIVQYLTLIIKSMDWRATLYEPLMVILIAYVGVTLVLWGRGIFCGWLCPFGALQELTNKLARAIRIPQYKIRYSVQQRLWSIKYLVAFGILGTASYSLNAAAGVAEIEPFKTAITMKFDRAWPYVVYASALLTVGLFVERFFCRYLCPLGAVLAVGGRFHILNWLNRRHECGNPCQICATSCPIGAIDDRGDINMNECFQCLDCQIDYSDDQRCPVLVSKTSHSQLLRGQETLAKSGQ